MHLSQSGSRKVKVSRIDALLKVRMRSALHLQSLRLSMLAELLVRGERLGVNGAVVVVRVS